MFIPILPQDDCTADLREAFFSDYLAGMLKQEDTVMSQCGAFKTGDQGQRYEVRAIGEDEHEFVLGWTEKSDGGNLVRAVEAHPAWHSPRVIDREAQ